MSVPVHAGEGSCVPHHPWVVRLGGPPLGDSHPDGVTGLVFRPDTPCGATVDDTGVGSEVPLVVLARYGGHVGGHDEPVLDPNGCPVMNADGEQLVERVYADGELVLLRGSVLALRGERDPSADPPTMTTCTPDTQSAVLEVKLAIRACGLPEPVIIDADSEIVVPAGLVSIEVLAPTGWVVGRGLPGSVETEWTDVVLRVSACPCDCGYHPEGRLTEAWTQDENFDPVTHVRPRRARRAVAVGNTAGGATATVTGTLQNDQTGTAGSRMGTLNFSTISGQPIELIGSAGFVSWQIAGGAGIGRIGVVWGVE